MAAGCAAFIPWLPTFLFQVRHTGTPWGRAVLPPTAAKDTFLDFAGSNTTAEIRIHPSGRFLYNTNRGHNSVTMYDVDADTGKLSVIGWQSTLGEWPRGMNIDPSGTFLYVGNQNTDTIAVFSIQPSNGKLKQSALVHTPTPVDIEFGPLA